MTQVLFGTKQTMTEAYLGDIRVPVTRITLYPMTIGDSKTMVRDGYQATQVIFGKGKKHESLAMLGHLKKSGVKAGKVREIPSADDQQMGTMIDPSTIVQPGSLIAIQGTTKGKGFAGAVKRWGFAGGSKTHGQSDRHRAPGSIGQGTTPGRVHRGKKMPGHMGHEQVTIKNTLCVAVDKNDIWVTGPIPGHTNTLLKLMITGQKDAPNLTYLKGYEKEAVKAEAGAPVTAEATIEATEKVQDAATAIDESATPTSESPETVATAKEEAQS
jgi:large subunit ribosomal protein L3